MKKLIIGLFLVSGAISSYADTHAEMLNNLKEKAQMERDADNQLECHEEVAINKQLQEKTIQLERAYQIKRREAMTVLLALSASQFETQEGLTSCDQHSKILEQIEETLHSFLD